MQLFIQMPYKMFTLLHFVRIFYLMAMLIDTDILSKVFSFKYQQSNQHLLKC